ncbi:MAG: helix-turn-helix domain-containing protein [Cellulosilyticaceae bacterium]
MDSSKLFLNPVRMRIIQYLVLNPEATSNEIITYIDDVPRTTLYRHLKMLEENGVIDVVRENRIRGTMEKVYGLNLSYTSNEGEEQSANAFFLGLLADFQNYFKEETHDANKDMLMFRTSLLIADDEEFLAFLTEYGQLLRKYMGNEMQGERKQRRVSIISSPF